MAALLLWLLPRDSTGGLLFGAYTLATFGGGYAVLMGMQIANTAGYTKRSLASSGIFVGYCLGKPFLQSQTDVAAVQATNADNCPGRQLRRASPLQTEGRSRIRTWFPRRGHHFFHGGDIVHCLPHDLRLGEQKER